MVARHRWSSGELGSPSAERLIICRARPLNSAFCCREACGDVFDGSGRGYRGGGFGFGGRPLPRFGFGRRRNTGAGVGGRTEAVYASMSASSMPPRALNASSRALCPSWLDARIAVDEWTLPSRSHHDRPVATARPLAVPDAFQRTPRFGRGPAAPLHQHGDGPTSAIAPSGVNLGAPRRAMYFFSISRLFFVPFQATAHVFGWEAGRILESIATRAARVEDPRTLALAHILSHGPCTAIASCTFPPFLRRRAVESMPHPSGDAAKPVEFVFVGGSVPDLPATQTHSFPTPRPRVFALR